MTEQALVDYVDLLADILVKSAAEHDRELPGWDRVLVAHDEGATGDVAGAEWTPLEDSEGLLESARARTTRGWVNVGADHVANGALYVVIEFLTDRPAVQDVPSGPVSVNLHGPERRWFDTLPKRR